jgi:hypothetical protein
MGWRKLERQMTPEQKVKHMILIRHAGFLKEPAPEGVTAETIDALYDLADGYGDGLQDARNEVRCGDRRTGLDSPSSRHYEGDEVASQAPDGSWVGWTYWHGGGKHGEPEAIDWIEYAYDLTCAEEEKLVTVRTFVKVSP